MSGAGRAPLLILAPAETSQCRAPISSGNADPDLPIALMGYPSLLLRNASFTCPHHADHNLYLPHVEHSNQASAPNQAVFLHVLSAAQSNIRSGVSLLHNVCQPQDISPTCPLRDLRECPHMFHVIFQNGHAEMPGLLFCRVSCASSFSGQFRSAEVPSLSKSFCLGCFSSFPDLRSNLVKVAKNNLRGNFTNLVPREFGGDFFEDFLGLLSGERTWSKTSPSATKSTAEFSNQRWEFHCQKCTLQRWR